ncbi:APC family permease [Streptomyces fuscichromogenes]|uniref:APC family permease n=1 Tax=Streptomyces fuscichromogenes TaxID=1324013 RepID=UPI0037F10D0A
MESAVTQRLKRDFRARDALIFSFATISPIAALYSVFGLVLVAAGPVGWWGYIGVLALQVLVACTLGLMVSRWPVEGGGYQWARRLGGPGYGWVAGWAYLWTWIIGVASVSYFMAGLVPPLVGIAPFTVAQQTLASLVIIALVTVLNVLGPMVLKVFTRLCLVAEGIGSVFLAFVLLIWHREHSLSVLTERAGAAHGDYLWGGFFFAVALIGYAFTGFESACSMAEEIKDPGRHLPKVMIYAILTLGAVVLISSLALLLAVPDLPAVMLGQVADPASDTIVAALGAGIAKPFLALILLAFAATLVACHTTASRVLWSLARDRSVPASKFLVKLSGRHDYPIRCLVFASGLSAVVTVSAFSNKIYTTLVAGATTGFYLTMVLIVGALAVKVLTGRFEYGPFHFGRATPVFVVVSLTWLTFEVINLCWPRVTGEAWYVTWAVPLGVAVIAALGVVVRLSVRWSGEDLDESADPDSDDELVASVA